MKISAIREDNTVYVDGAARTVTWSTQMPDGWRAIQWDGTTGHIEFDDARVNQPLTNPALPLLAKAAWDAGAGLGVVEASPVDVVAAARAAVLDKLVLEQAQAPDAEPLMLEAAAKIAEVQNANAALAAKAEVTARG